MFLLVTGGWFCHEQSRKCVEDAMKPSNEGGVKVGRQAGRQATPPLLHTTHATLSGGRRKKRREGQAVIMRKRKRGSKGI